jgi:hypothetical protein
VPRSARRSPPLELPTTGAVSDRVVPKPARCIPSSNLQHADLSLMIAGCAGQWI